jgi:O-antigen ligase
MTSQAWRAQGGLVMGGIALSLSLALGAGRLMGDMGLAGIAVLLLAGAALLVLRYPFLGLLVLSINVAIENLMILESVGGATFNRLLGTAVFGAWFTGKLAKRQPLLSVFASPLAISGGLFVLMALLSTLWAADPTVAISGSIQFLQFVALGVMTADLVSSWNKADILVKFLVFGGVIAAALTLNQALVEGHRRAGDNIAGGINATAVLLVTLMPLAFYLLRVRGRLGWKLLGLLYLSLAIPATVLTYSRMNLLVLPLLLAFLVVDTLRDSQGRKWVLSLAVVTVMVVPITVPLERVERSLRTVIPYLEGTFLDADDGIVEPSGRGYHWRVGIQIFRENPLIGAGFRNYGVLFRDEYQFVVPGPGRLYYSARSPHSVHIGTLANVGVIGFLLWLAIPLTAAGIPLRRAWWRTRLSASHREHILVRSLAVALLLQVGLYGWYAEIDRNKEFWLLLGLAGAIGLLTRNTMEDPGCQEAQDLRRLAPADDLRDVIGVGQEHRSS